jgi:hypothetical protein
LSDQGCPQGLGKVWNTRQSLSSATKGLGETTPAIDLPQEVFTADERKRARNGLPQLCEPWGQLQGVAPVQRQAPPLNRDKGMAREPAGGSLGGLVECVRESRPTSLRHLGQLQVRVGQFPFLCPSGRVIEQIRKGAMTTTRREEDVT